jgi:Na+/melibiose symporter-like transporter
MALYLRTQRQGRRSFLALGLAMLVIQAFISFGPTLPSDRGAAVTALAWYVVFAGIIAWWERRHTVAAPSAGGLI